MNNNMHYDSGNVEWATPLGILVPIVKTYLGGTFMDPFCSDAIAERLKPFGLARWFTEEQDGFTQEWGHECRNVWINHPFGVANNRRFVDKLDHEIGAGRIGRFAGICYDAWGTQWFSTLVDMVDLFWHPMPGSPGCTRSGRVAYINFTPDVLGKGYADRSPQKSSVVYFGSAINDDDLVYDAYRATRSLNGVLLKRA